MYSMIQTSRLWFVACNHDIRTGVYQMVDDGFYFEPSEFDEKVDEFKKSLRASVKEEILSEME